MMLLPHIAQKKSYKIEVEEGKSYYWCSCGLSQSQPFCDGSHQGKGFEPIEFIAEKNGIVGFCGCKYSKLGAICDGIHKTL